MQPKLYFRPNPNQLVSLFLLLSLGFSIAVLSLRNLYDDEISSFNTITSPVASILRLIAVTDAHPPGMYLLGHFAYRIIPSFRWMDLFSAMFLYTGLTVFVSQVAPLLTSTRSRTVFLLLATLHPQLLMWGVTYRWYGWWTGIALIAVTVALQPLRYRPSLTVTRSAILGLLLAALFYLNFITFLFAVALAGAMLLRYRFQRTALVIPALVTSGVFLSLAAPQFPTMIAVHLPSGAAQRSSILNSTLHLLESLAASEAYLPWHPLAIAADLLFLTFCFVALRYLFRLLRTKVEATSLALDSPLAPILLFGLLFLFLVAITGLGGKPRNALLLIPVLAPAAALITDKLRPPLRLAILLFLALWSAVGIVHLIGRRELSKATMISRPEQVANFVRQTSGPGCSVVVTYDAPLAFTLNQANLQHALVVSPFREPILGSTHLLPELTCADVHLYIVQSYAGVDPDAVAELPLATHFFIGQARTDSFSMDPDAARKRSLAKVPFLGRDLASAANLPDYRYVVISGISDLRRISAMRQQLPDYLSGQQ